VSNKKNIDLPPSPQNTSHQLVNESFHETASLEWWFIQGYYEGKQVDRRYFMTSIFKHKVSSTKKSKGSAFSFLFSVLNPQTGEQETSTRIDRLLLEDAAHSDNLIEGINIDQRIIKSFMSEIIDFGPPRNIELIENDVELRADPFRIKWCDFILELSKDHFILSFNELKTDRCCEFKLLPVKGSISIPKVAGLDKPGSGMNYNSYPRLQLTGEVDGDAVSGGSWLDHQWGDRSWIIAGSDTKKVRGWDWFGINLDDSSDLVIIVTKDVQSGEPLTQQAIYRDKNNKQLITQNIILKPLRIWESNKTYIRHPVEWQIILPEFRIDLTFTPVSDDQEIPVFGLMRAIWEGVGEIKGTLDGASVKGTARGEFFGYGYIFNFNDFMKVVASRVDRHIESFLPKFINDMQLDEYMGPPTWKYEPTAYTEMLSEPVWDLISRGGKRWRPIFAILLLDALDGNVELFEPMICSLAELLHTGSLIVDDIQDASLKRRGGESLHIRYGEDIAISAANTLYFLPSLLIFNHPHLNKGQKREIHEIMMKQNIRAHFGQALDLFWSRNMDDAHLKNWMNDSLAPKILQMYALKTAAPIEGLATSSAILANVDGEIKNTCIELASALGVAFQIIDDIHCFSKSPNWKKECGEDIAEGKLTYVIYRALESLKGADQKQLHRILCSKSLRKNLKNVNEAVELVYQSGVLKTCREEANALIEKSAKKPEKC
jgi:geranylgeranyl pyrophosphate synthase/predicted secreted hydrolase